MYQYQVEQFVNKNREATFMSRWESFVLQNSYTVKNKPKAARQAGQADVKEKLRLPEIVFKKKVNNTKAKEAASEKEPR